MKFSYNSPEAPKLVIWVIVSISLIIIGLVLTPTFSDEVSKYLHPLTIDADPENMLEKDDPARVFHRQQKERFSLYDMIVVGAVNRLEEHGVFNARSLAYIHDLVDFAKTLTWEGDNGEREGVISADLMAPSTVDNIEQGGLGIVRFEWLMDSPPVNDREALAIREKIRNLPMFNGTMLSNDGKGLALYIPITSKGISYKIREMLRERIATYHGADEFFITGLPVAQDTFAVEMFKQMATTSPAAMILIFVLLWYFFRNVRLIISPMIVAMVSVIITMGLLVITGNELHIMSSMVPIFVMPIAVLDSIHILSEFYDRYPEFKDRKQTIRQVMFELRKPMLYTTVTTAVGFLSLNLTPLPPLQVFGTFVGIGVVLAWLLTVTIIPAYIILMPEHRFADFGMKPEQNNQTDSSFLSRLLRSLGSNIPRYSKATIAIGMLIFVISIDGILQIKANDNPVKWFGQGHEIRKADKVLNEMFGGTYMAYLSLENGEKPLPYDQAVNHLEQQLSVSALKPLRTLATSVIPLSKRANTKDALIRSLARRAEEGLVTASEDEIDEWYQSIDYLEERLVKNEIFKDPKVLNYMSGLQDHLSASGFVGKSNSVADIVKTVHRELHSGEQTAYRIPGKPGAVAQTLITFEGSHRPQDLWHFVTPDFQQANIWLQLRSGDNQDMTKVEELVADYFAKNPPPRQLVYDWFGLTHINVTWQDQIVLGMAKALAGSFVIVLVMMIILFRSVLWGMLAMVPLSFSIAVLYGIVGLIGRNYDAPIAVLSALSLGLSVDYAIHFLSRSRQMRKNYSSWKETSGAMFGEPARAISRNVIVVGIGFLPLLISSLVPYKTVGIFISAILVFSGIASLVILPTLIHLFEKWLFKKGQQAKVDGMEKTLIKSTNPIILKEEK